MIKKHLAKMLATIEASQAKKWKNHAEDVQHKLLLKLVQKAVDTQFGKDHNFHQITDHASFVKNVPVRNYEQLLNYINPIVEGQSDILWPGKPLYLAKTSGTTAGSKYIPLTKQSMPYHIKAARNAMLNYMHISGEKDFIDGKMIFLQGSPILEEKNGIQLGRLSGIVAHFVPNYLQKNRMPSWETNCIENWESKIDAIAEETLHENMTLISGIPPWLIMYFEKLKEKSGKKVGEIFPNLQLIITGGVNYEPYRGKMQELIGRKVDTIQTFPASEGFFAYQDQLDSESLLLLPDHGIFYEFIPLEFLEDEKPKRLTLDQVEMGVNYALVLSTNAGLWGYSIGDTVQFTSLKPYRIVVSGRTKHYTSAFGEHVIAQEVEKAMDFALKKHTAIVNEFHVAPQVNPQSGLPYHEWMIEFSQLPENLDDFAQALNEEMSRQNAYYRDLTLGQVLRNLVITPVKEGGFQQYMKSQGKLGGQNKTPRLSNNRSIADQLVKMDTNPN